MSSGLSLFFTAYIKLFFLLTPPFVLSMFLALTKGMSVKQQRGIAIRVTLAVIVTCFTLYWFGNAIFATFGITLDAFRIGAGSLLFLSSVELVRGASSVSKGKVPESTGEISVVPLAIPITVGPATIGTLLIMGATAANLSQEIIGAAALICAACTVGVVLFLANYVERLIGAIGITILTKITGLILSALSAQIVFTGIKNFLG